MSSPEGARTEPRPDQGTRLVDQRRFELLTSPVREENRPHCLPAHMRVLPGQNTDSTVTNDHVMTLIFTSHDDQVMTQPGSRCP